MSALLCPIDADELKLVILEAMLPIEAVAHQCDTCGGALLDVAAQKLVLGQGLAVSGEARSARLSPRTGEPMVRIEAGEVALDGCAQTGEIWFDRGELLVVRELVARLRGEALVADEPQRPDPLRGLYTDCADCAEPLRAERRPVDSPIGLVCSTCPRRLGFGASEPVAGRRALEHAGSQVVVEHVMGRRYRGAVRAELGFEGALEVRFAALTFWQRVLGGRGVDPGQPALRKAYRVHAADTEGLGLFLRRRGPLELLLELASLGEAQVELGREAFVARVRSEGGGDDVALRFEQSARRLLELYAAFSRGTRPPRRASH